MGLVSIPFGAMRWHTAGAVRLGWSLETLLAKSMITLRYGDERDVISPEQGLLLCMNTVLAVEDATHGLARAGLRAKYAAIGLMMALGCSTLEGAISSLSRLYASGSTAVRVKLEAEHDAAILSVYMDTTDEFDRPYLEENFLIWMFMQCLHYLGRAPPILEIVVRDPHHFNMGSRHWAIRGPVRYGEVTAFRFPRTWLAEPRGSRADGNVMWACHKRWLTYLEGQDASPTVSEYLRDGGFVRFSDLVQDSGMSANTLRRRLQSSEGGFRDARQRALAEAASARLRASEDSVEAIAEGLGYSDARSFRRFLKNATGFTPQQVRDRSSLDKNEANDHARHEVQVLSERMEI